MVWDSRVSVYHSATAIFHAPSNPSGPGGMYREVIRSTPWWTKGDVSGLRRDCIFVDCGESDEPGMRGLLVAQVYLFFRFSYTSVEYPCALVHWYNKVGTSPDSSNRLWVVEPEYFFFFFFFFLIYHWSLEPEGSNYNKRSPLTNL